MAAFQREEAIEVREGVAEVTVDCSTPSLTEFVADRLRYLCEETLRALRVASVLGGTCTAADLAAVLDIPDA
ncbi:hypothetical protein YWIDRAFT_07421 [Streptomyces sp. SceaMP-e96]|uniref:hypothetical protein n=1 Tax=Streptomyces TaxID=1883 RepID=UPI000823CDF5|nr:MULTISPECIES: hypothetical protein [unclassified Streptomyces]MYT17786.1 hypothetical protein [Streptomyces sp. SID4951]SCK46883.1 hypothetical protein YWIDRAFT_07421 [Streptomyces sp. SceaMP-e96]